MSKITVPAQPGYSLLKRYPWKKHIANSLPILAWQIDDATNEVQPITLTGVALVKNSEVLLPHDENEQMEATVLYLATGEWISLEMYLNRGEDDYKFGDEPAEADIDYDMRYGEKFPLWHGYDGGGLTFDGRHDDHFAYQQYIKKTDDRDSFTKGEFATEAQRDVGERMLKLATLSSREDAMAILKKVGKVEKLSLLEPDRHGATLKAINAAIKKMYAEC